MSVDKQGDLRIDSWLIKIFLTNGTEKTIVELPDEISQSIDDYLSEIQEELIFGKTKSDWKAIESYITEENGTFFVVGFIIGVIVGCKGT